LSGRLPRDTDERCDVLPDCLFLKLRGIPGADASSAVLTVVTVVITPSGIGGGSIRSR
jgi:hypothetical protein